MPKQPTWGLVATIKAPAPDILRFAAHHLALGAHRLFIYLDAYNPEAEAALKAHPKCRVTLCTDAYWKQRTGKPPQKHQVRQATNATHAYRKKADVDWLTHIDVDEFLVPHAPIAEILAQTPEDTHTLRIRPMERLADGDGTAFKAFIPPGPDRSDIVASLYPTYGAHLKGGFLSHVAGKVFLRTGLPDVSWRIHNVFQGELMNPGAADFAQVDLAHCHAQDWDQWRAHLTYRHAKGSYRADIAPANDGMASLHSLFADLLSQGETALRSFYDEVVADTPVLRARLNAKGLLRHAHVGQTTDVAHHFPDFVDLLAQP